ncbi:unnamed protein product [Didymodactylos carnosus]|uniref:Pentapeptide repeat-containing protein n=1 Tax=Didymodactylos carnosus TaxID=1234261 RepID=A0A815QQP1_9BILA|nr:unnamed protein product [Didymodactylos carnosus]CAF4334567.1 unnamed protein product [Didymodactylos carnosus]
MPWSSDRVEAVGRNKSATKQEKYFKLTFHELLPILCSAAVPIVICVYTAITTYEQTKEAERRQFDLKQVAEERRLFDLTQANQLRQQLLYDQFIDNMYTLDKDGQLNDSAKPWAFPNARYWTAHRQWEPEHKGHSLIFLKKIDLIGRQCHGPEGQLKRLDDIIQLNQLNFDNIRLKSQNSNMHPLNMTCIRFDEVSLINVSFTFVNLDYASFDASSLNGSKFEESSLIGTIFNATQLHGTDFSNSDLQDAHLYNVILSTVKITEEQRKQAKFTNITLLNASNADKSTTTTGKL